MKNRLLLAAVFMIVPVLASAESPVSKFLRDSYLTASSNSNWVIRIENNFLSSDEFRRGYVTFLSNLSSEPGGGNYSESYLKKTYLESYISQYTVLMKALEDQVFDSPEMQTYFRAAVMQAVVQIYLQWLMEKQHPDFSPTTDEINSFYQANQQQIAGMGLNSEQIRQLIIEQVSQQKMQAWMKDQLSLVKEGYRVKRNTDRLHALGFDQ